MTNKIQQISKVLQHKITQEIKQKGAISFANFMKMALYEPGLGYYSAGLKKFGREGDFITAPELGPLFAQTLANFFAAVLSDIKHPVIMELGAGQGTFCYQLLKQLDTVNQLPSAYWILEISADLKKTQQQQIAQLPKHISQKVRWLNQLPDESFEGIIFGNEVLDALPVEVFQIFESGPQRLMLCDKQGELKEQWQPFPEVLLNQLASKSLDLPVGYRSEFIPHLQSWMEGVVQCLRTGVVLWVDYGYGAKQLYHPQRQQGTLVCHQRHQANFNPYQSIGTQDMTSFVDFTHVATVLDGLGFDVCSFTHQSDFLMSLGLTDLINENAKFKDYYQQISEMKQLVLPNEMGEKFKVLAAKKNTTTHIPGFEHNRSYDL